MSTGTAEAGAAAGAESVSTERHSQWQWLVPAVLGVLVLVALTLFSIQRNRRKVPEGAYVAHVNIMGVAADIEFVFDANGTVTQTVDGDPSDAQQTMNWRRRADRVDVRNAEGSTWGFQIDGEDLMLVERDGALVPHIRYTRQSGPAASAPVSARTQTQSPSPDSLPVEQPSPPSMPPVAVAPPVAQTPPPAPVEDLAHGRTTDLNSIPLHPVSTRASSFINNPGRPLSAELAFDGSESTAWNESARGPGQGEWIEADYGAPVHIHHIRIATGWDYTHPRDGDLFTTNSHLRRFRVTFDGGNAIEREVTTEERHVDVRVDVAAQTMRILALDVYPGTRWRDLCISEIEVLGTRRTSPSAPR